MLSDVGIGQSIIRHSRRDDPEFYNTAWTLQVIRGAVLALIGVALAWPVGQFYDPFITRFIAVISLTALISGFNSTKIFTANRDMQLADHDHRPVDASDCHWRHGRIGLDLSFHLVAGDRSSHLRFHSARALARGISRTNESVLLAAGGCSRTVQFWTLDFPEHDVHVLGIANRQTDPRSTRPLGHVGHLRGCIRDDGDRRRNIRTARLPRSHAGDGACVEGVECTFCGNRAPFAAIHSDGAQSRSPI